MEGIKSHKKRKRPFNWDDIYQSSSEDERQIIKKRVSTYKEYNLIKKYSMISNTYPFIESILIP